LRDGVAQPAGIAVTVPARLHLGFLDLNGGLGRRFGGIGLAISDLNTTISVRRARQTEVSGPESDRVRRYVRITEQALALESVHDVSVADVVPAHAGLGSGTQIALAVAAGLRRLHNLPLATESDALRLGRGARSGIGIGLFHHGGLVVDGGRDRSERPAPIIARLSFPEHWRILLILDPQRRGLHGADEAASFANLPPMSEADAAHNCRLVVIKALPALAVHDIVNFGQAIKELQARLGDYFSAAQGDARFASRDVASVLEALDRAGAHGIGQSSWGPTGFAFAPSAEEADRLATVASRHPSSQGLDIRICTGLNHGAEIVVYSKAQRSGQ
jgi:beta-ribofuranosylaminobenzene 5'-phosphate synthase